MLKSASPLKRVFIRWSSALIAVLLIPSLLFILGIGKENENIWQQMQTGTGRIFYLIGFVLLALMMILAALVIPLKIYQTSQKIGQWTLGVLKRPSNTTLETIVGFAVIVFTLGLIWIQTQIFFIIDPSMQHAKASKTFILLFSMIFIAFIDAAIIAFSITLILFMRWIGQKAEHALLGEPRPLTAHEVIEKQHE